MSDADMQRQRQIARAQSLKNARNGFGPQPRYAATSSRQGAVPAKNQGARDFADALVAGAGAALDEAAKPALQSAGRGVRATVRGANGLPGLVLSAGEIAAADDKARATASAIGGEVVGDLLASIGGPFAPVLKAVGGYAGSKGTEFFYDHRAEWAPEVGRAALRGENYQPW